MNDVRSWFDTTTTTSSFIGASTDLIDCDNNESLSADTAVVVNKYSAAPGAWMIKNYLHWSFQLLMLYLIFRVKMLVNNIKLIERKTKDIDS